MAADLDAQVAEFRARPLDAGPYTFVAADALVLWLSMTRTTFSASGWSVRSRSPARPLPADGAVLATTHDCGALLRVVAGGIAGHTGLGDERARRGIGDVALVRSCRGRCGQTLVAAQASHSAA